MGRAKIHLASDKIGEAKFLQSLEIYQERMDRCIFMMSMSKNANTTHAHISHERHKHHLCHRREEFRVKTVEFKFGVVEVLGKAMKLESMVKEWCINDQLRKIHEKNAVYGKLKKIDVKL